MKRLLAALIVATTLMACSSTNGPSPSGTATAARPAINEQTRGQIQALLQRQHDTEASRDQNGFAATIDPDRLALKRCANESFDIAGRQGVGAVPQVGKIEPYLDTYVRENYGAGRRELASGDEEKRA